MEKLELTENYNHIEEIPAYGFAGREDLEEILLPASVRKIGRYAFYNCINLCKITFHSGIRDVGSGTFTGCHKVNWLDVTIVQGKPSCLKDFLQELTEELLVEYRGETYARLMFPEYFEEGVENTPARILMTQIHGSGLKYRNCFLKTEFQFEEYDARFPYARAVESPEFLQEMVLGRLMYPCGLQEKGREQYEAYLGEQFTEIGKRLIARTDTDRLAWLLEHYLESEKQAEELIMEAGMRGNAVCGGCLMEWRRRKFALPGKNSVPDFDL